MRHNLRKTIGFTHDRPVLIDKFLEQATEFDVDALADAGACVIAGIQEHIEEAGIHSGDSSCVLPPVRINPEHLETMRHYTRKLAKALSVRGLMNIQFAIKDHRVYVLEVNPRSFTNRTVCFESYRCPDRSNRGARDGRTETCRVWIPGRIDGEGLLHQVASISVYEVSRSRSDSGSEMHSTGEVMGIGSTFGEAYAKAMIGAGLSCHRR